MIVSNDQDELKTLVGQAALQYVMHGEIVASHRLDRQQVHRRAGFDQGPDQGAVSSSNASTERLRALGIAVFDCNEVGELSVYIDGADEIDAEAT